MTHALLINPQEKCHGGSPIQVLRNTKIVCTLGPASQSPAQIRQLILAGANVFRLNFSHSNHDWHSQVLATIRQTAAQLETSIAVMQDLCGPKIRVSHLSQPDLRFAVGEEVRLTTAEHATSAAPPDFHIASTYAALIGDVSIGDRILLDDGRIELEAIEKQSRLLVARVVRGGPVLPNKGINLPGIALSTRSMTDKDWTDLEWGIANEVDFVALSFVRHPNDIAAVRQRLDERGSSSRLIAKIERPEAVAHLDAILALADGLMVARGDLGLETELSQVPLLQKRLIERCRQANKPVITATQMLESMVLDSTPTRAEVSDVANAIYDGTDAIMLSAETATGRFPEAAVGVLARVAQVTEAATHAQLHQRSDNSMTPATAIVEGAAITARALEAQRVVVYSRSGQTARLLAHYRLPMPVVAITDDEHTYRQLALSYGVQSLYMPQIVSMPQLLAEMDRLVVERGWGRPGDTLVLVSSLDGRDGATDTLHIHYIR